MTLKLILAFVIAFAVSAVVGFFLVPYLKRIKAGQSIKENGPTWHMSKQGTPTMGGLMFIAAIAVVCLSVGFECMAEGEYGHLFCLAFALVFGAIGFLDDYEKLKKKQNLGLTAGKKLLLQLAAAVAFIFLMRRFGYVALDSLYIPFWNKTVPVSEPLYVIFAAFVIVGTVNSVNLTDGVDGLAASTTMPVCIFFAVISMLWGERFLSLGVFASGLAGGLLGFLIYNFHPAKVFMGDTGSLFLGGAVAALAFAYDMPLILVTLGIMYIIEALSDIIQVGYFKLTHGKRVFKMSPFHHHLEMGGWTGHKWKETQIVALFAGVTVLFGRSSACSTASACEARAAVQGGAYMNISDLRLPARQTKASAGPKRGSFDLPFFVLTLLLLTIGVIMVLSSSFARAYAQGKSPTYYFVRQAAFAVAGVVAMILLSKVRMVTYRRLSLLVLGVSIFLLAVVWIPHIGTRVNGARRWLSLGFTTFQPSEIAKIAVVLFFSSMICTYKEQMQTFRYGVVPFMVVTVIIVGLLMLEPHLSASIIIMALAIVMMFVGGIKLSYLLVGMGSAGALLLIASKFVPYVHKRIVSWRDPFADTSAAGYQIVQSLYSIGSGGFLGLGLGQSRQKYLYLPEEHNDYIFSIVCEELGYVGAIAILILFALLICRGYWIAAHSPDRYSFLVGIGITTLLSIQVFLNIAVVTNLIPCTGISLPFFSYGGTALLMQLGEMGIILSISRDIPTKKAR